MYNFCTKCDCKNVVPENGYAVCKGCGNSIKLSEKPLFIVLGASGVGKSSLCTSFAANFKQVVSLDGDSICSYDWFKTRSNGEREYYNQLLRICKNIIQADKPVVLYNHGKPSDFKNCPEFRFFKKVYFISLVCDNDELEKHLRQRPKYRDCGNSVFIASQKLYNEQLKKLDKDAVIIDNTKFKTSQTTMLLKKIIYTILKWS